MDISPSGRGVPRNGNSMREDDTFYESFDNEIAEHNPAVLSPISNPATMHPEGYQRELRAKRKQRDLSIGGKERGITESTTNRKRPQTETHVRFAQDIQSKSATYDGAVGSRKIWMKNDYTAPEAELRLDADSRSYAPIKHESETGDPAIGSRRLSPNATQSWQSSVNCLFGSLQPGKNHELSFASLDFHPSEARSFSEILDPIVSNSVGLLFLIITGWQPWFLDHVVAAFPDYPTQALLNFDGPRTTTMLPVMDTETQELTCIMEHIDVAPESQNPEEPNEEIIFIGPTKARISSLALWTRRRGAFSTHPDRPFVMVISAVSSERIGSEILHHYLDLKQVRWNRLSENLEWAYLDLYFLFTRWDQVFTATKQNFNRRMDGVYTKTASMSIIEQTRQLHKENNVMIGLRELIRIHKESLNIIRYGIESLEGGYEGLKYSIQRMKKRFTDALRLLDYYELTATTLLEQQQNLLSLAFNLETIHQGQAVARLNALAFIFLPLSFVASVFGITTFTAPPQWYPVFACPLLIFTLIVAYAANKLFESSPRHSNSHSHSITYSTSKPVASWPVPSRRVLGQKAEVFSNLAVDLKVSPQEYFTASDPSRITLGSSLKNDTSAVSRMEGKNAQRMTVSSYEDELNRRASEPPLQDLSSRTSPSTPTRKSKIMERILNFFGFVSVATSYSNKDEEIAIRINASRIRRNSNNMKTWDDRMRSNWTTIPRAHFGRDERQREPVMLERKEREVDRERVIVRERDFKPGREEESLRAKRRAEIRRMEG